MSCCCCDIFTCHAELIHAAGEIQHAVVSFEARDWRGLNYLKIIPHGTLGPNEIGPHRLPAKSYSVTVLRTIAPGVVKEVGVTMLTDRATGIITIWKTSLVPAFGGKVEVR